MNRLVLKFCMVNVACVFLVMMVPLMAFASEEDLKLPMIEPQNNLFDIGLAVCVIGIIGMTFGLFLYLRRRKDKSS